jgi:replicative DNA helicase
LDADLLQIVRKQENYHRFAPYIKEHTLSKEAVKIFHGMGEYFKSYPTVDELSWDSFSTWFLVLKNSTLSPDSVDTYKAIFSNLRSKVSTPVLEDVMKHYIACDYATQIVNVGIQVAKGDGAASLDQVEELVKKYDKEVGRAISKAELFVTDDTAVALSTDPGLSWRLEELNISCGPLRQGDFVVLGARPETGKTTFLADQVSYMAQQIKDNRPVIWVNNEERSTKVKRRIVQATLGITLKDYQANPAKAMASYKKLMGMDDRILVTGSGAGLNSAKLLVPLFRDLNPAFIVFDQLDKVAGFERKSDKEDQRLGDLYEWARELSHEYGPVIAASQANDSAEGQQWIYQNQLRGSRTDKAGEADAIITIGKVHDAAKANKRYIHIPKNKLDGGPRSEEKHRHGFWEVEIRQEIARYEGVH